MITEEEKNKKAIAFYKNFVKSKEEELDWMYKQDEEYYRDEIEQSELLIIGFKRILNLITKLQEENKKKDKVIDEIDTYCKHDLAFERRLKKENREPDLFNQGRFSTCANILKLLEGKVVVENE